jgi:hypothetical protein
MVHPSFLPSFPDITNRVLMPAGSQGQGGERRKVKEEEKEEEGLT